MGSVGSTVRVSGLKEALRALKDVGDCETREEVKDALYRGAQLVVQRAQGNTSDRMEAAAAQGLRAGKTQNRAQVTFTAKRGFEFGAEFGAFRNQPRRRSRFTYRGFNQFKPWRGSGEGAGYFLYPAIRETAPLIEQSVGDEILRIFAGHGGGGGGSP